MEGIQFKDGKFVVSAEQARHAVELFVAALKSSDPEQHRLLAETILPPIQTVADYTEYSAGLLVSQTRELQETIRVAIHTPTVISFYTSTEGGPLYVRPTRKYATVDYKTFDVGIEIGWKDVKAAGWPIIEQLMKEKGEELARKRDSIRMTAIDAAVEATSGHTSSVSTTMSKASVDAIFEDAATAGFQITRVRLNTGRAMNMTGWTWDANGMWQLGFDRGEEIIRNGYISNYGGATWEAFVSHPASYVYFYGEPIYVGYEWNFAGYPEERSDTDVKAGYDYYRYDDALGAYALGHAVWRLQIT